MSKRDEQGYAYWDEHPRFSVNDWVHEVNNGDTRMGYWEWVWDREAHAELEEPSPPLAVGDEPPF